MGMQLVGLGTALPQHSISQELAARWAAELAGASQAEAADQAEIFRRTGVRRRSSVLLQRDAAGRLEQSFYGGTGLGPKTAERMRRYASEAPALALSASTQAIAQSMVELAEITHVITVSCTGCIAPGLDFTISESLGLSPQVARTHIGFMGCAGVFNALALAKPILEADPAARVLVCAVEVCSLHFRFDQEIQQIIANSLFADGAAALVGQAATTRGAAPDWVLEATGSYTIAGTSEALGWKIGDYGFEMQLSVDLPNLISSNVRQWLVAWLQRQRLSLADIPTWAIHPGGPRILGAVVEALGLPHDAVTASAEVLQQRGNMSSPTILFILDKLRRQNAPRPCVALGFGPGVVAHAALFR